MAIACREFQGQWVAAKDCVLHFCQAPDRFLLANLAFVRREY